MVSQTVEKEKKRVLESFDDEFSGKSVRIFLNNGEKIEGRCVASKYFIKIIGKPVRYVNKASIVYIELIE
jgi:sRNA-binding regulator protein Hfq